MVEASEHQKLQDAEIDGGESECDETPPVKLRTTGQRRNFGSRTLSVHSLGAQDIARGAVAPTLATGVLLYAGDEIPPQHQWLLGDSCNPYCSLDTKGDGACGVHAVFGLPQGGKLKCDEGLRSLVASYFEEYMQDVLDGGKQDSANFKNVRTTWWSEFCLPSAKWELQERPS